MKRREAIKKTAACGVAVAMVGLETFADGDGRAMADNSSKEQDFLDVIDDVDGRERHKSLPPEDGKWREFPRTWPSGKIKTLTVTNIDTAGNAHTTMVAINEDGNFLVRRAMKPAGAEAAKVFKALSREA